METVRYFVSGFRDFVEKHFDKLFLGSLLGLLLRLLWHVYHHAADHTQFVENMSGQVLAALLTLITGARLTQRGSDNGNGGSNGNQTKVPGSGAAVPDASVGSVPNQPAN